MNKYQKIVSIDEKIDSLKKLIKHIVRGDEYTSGGLVGTADFYTTVRLSVKSEWGDFKYQDDDIEYKILGNLVIQSIRQEIAELNKEREKLVVPFYKRWFK